MRMKMRIGEKKKELRPVTESYGKTKNAKFKWVLNEVLVCF